MTFAALWVTQQLPICPKRDTECWDHRGLTRTARHDTARHDTAWHGTAWHGTARHGKARQGKARQGTARQGPAMQCTARCTGARLPGTARHGTARPGRARHGKARHGTAQHCTAVPRAGSGVPGTATRGPRRTCENRFRKTITKLSFLWLATVCPEPTGNRVIKPNCFAERIFTVCSAPASPVLVAGSPAPGPGNFTESAKTAFAKP